MGRRWLRCWTEGGDVMTDAIMLMVFGRSSRQTRRVTRTKRRTQYRDPMADITRATVGGVQAMIAVTIGMTALRAVRG